MNPILRLINSSVGKKYIMGITGAALYGFVIIHMVGNLQIFLPPDAINAYAKLLKASPEVLWGFRLGLLGCGVLHIWAAITLTLENRRVRPVDYLDKKPLKASFASRTMAVSGIILATFLVYHILHFTAHITHPCFADFKTTLDGKEVHDVYNMVIYGFTNPAVSGFYILGVGMLCFHLSHGIQSLFQSLGLVTVGYKPWTQWLGRITSVVIFIGMVAVPAAVLAGALKHTPEFRAKAATICPAKPAPAAAGQKACCPGH